MSIDRLPNFNQGETILYRGLDQHSQIIDVKPVIVIEDTDSRVVLWLPLGTLTLRAQLLNPSSEGPRRWDQGWHLVEAPWWSEMLIIVYRHQLRSTLVRWTKERVFYSWYVNLQSRLRHTYLGYDSRDFQLDIVVDPDRNWRWKDENELNLAIELGRLTPAQGDGVRAEAQRAIAEIKRNAAPYSDGWERWQPNNTFAPPELTSEWDDLSMYDGSSNPKEWGDDLLSSHAR